MKNWELIEEDVPQIMEKNYPFLGITNKFNVLVDIYRKKKRNGLFKYKKVVKK